MSSLMYSFRANPKGFMLVRLLRSIYSHKVEALCMVKRINCSTPDDDDGKGVGNRGGTIVQLFGDGCGVQAELCGGEIRFAGLMIDHHGACAGLGFDVLQSRKVQLRITAKEYERAC